MPQGVRVRLPLEAQLNEAKAGPIGAAFLFFESYSLQPEIVSRKAEIIPGIILEDFQIWQYRKSVQRL